MDDLLVHTVKQMLGKLSPELVEMVHKIINTKLGEKYPWPGNVRELEQCVHRILIKRNYEGDDRSIGQDLCSHIYYSKLVFSEIMQVSFVTSCLGTK
ncbi:MAG: hypothetical protein V1872_02635 [bacterium]